jgi:transposase InsO family protein
MGNSAIVYKNNFTKLHHCHPREGGDSVKTKRFRINLSILLIENWINHYNRYRPQSTFDGQTPHEVYLKIKNLNGASHSETKLAA